MNISSHRNILLKNLDLSIFSQIEKEDWLQLAEKQLKGANPVEHLAWENEAGIIIQGYYDRSDVTELSYLSDFFASIKPHRWKLFEAISPSNSKLANKQALEALMGGCDGIILDHPVREDMPAILTEVDPKICSISLISNEEISYDTASSGFHLTPNGNCIRSLEQNPVLQLKELLSSLKDEAYVYRLASGDFFLEIATLRSLRYLLHSNEKGYVQIHTHIPIHESDEHQWFLNTTAGLASVLGGTHSVDFTTATGDSRISRNTGNLIREESGIEMYEDQCGGSYYIDVLTDKIIKEVLES